MPRLHVYEPLEAPDVGSTADGRQAWTRIRTTHDDGRPTYQVQYRREGSTYLDGFPAERVRRYVVDRSAGRGQIARAGGGVIAHPRERTDDGMVGI